MSTLLHSSITLLQVKSQLFFSLLPSCLLDLDHRPVQTSLSLLTSYLLSMHLLVMRHSAQSLGMVVPRTSALESLEFKVPLVPVSVFVRHETLDLVLELEVPVEITVFLPDPAVGEALQGLDSPALFVQVRLGQSRQFAVLQTLLLS